MVYLFYTTYSSIDLAHHEICLTKFGKSGINYKICENMQMLQILCSFRGYTTMK